MSDAQREAETLIRNKTRIPDFQTLKRLVEVLKSEFQFGVARKLLSMVRDTNGADGWVVESPDDSKRWIVQQLALCTYKDEELIPEPRFDQALALLKDIGLLDPNNKSAETLALGGAVYKRLWEYDGQLESLHQAFAFYLAAWERNPDEDKGYEGVNAAYVLDVLAFRLRVIASRSGTDKRQADELKDRATRLRENIVAALERRRSEKPEYEKEYWFLVTLAEAFFGSEQYDKAGDWLARASALASTEWERQTTFRQLVSIARLHEITLPGGQLEPAGWHPAWKALGRFLGEGAAQAFSCYRGKVGLALSGGGFRASLFHLGALARFAEVDALRGVEALSTVSGGSIVGAHYYLELQNLLKRKPDGSITRDDYIELVRRLQEQFLCGIRKNLRTRVFTNLLKNLKMILPGYSRSHRMGELYEQYLYASVRDGKEAAPREMPGLLVKPHGHPEQETFKPKFSNWRRSAKVPTLLINTTSLNSGHNWHFTARWMGEPPGSIGAEVDANDRYRRLWYEDAPTDEFKRYRLGYAVAASACVPGLFDPLVLKGLYRDRTVRLVDGGVHDNQGVEALLDEGCTVILCSDASGQMDDQKDPANGFIGVPLRTNSILMDRVREAQYERLKAKLDSHALTGLFFIHLKKELQPAPLDWIGCNDPTPPSAQALCTTSYGVDRDLQRKLAAIRTDLDSFTEVEACSLMLSGYLMAERELKALQEKHQSDGHTGAWGDFDVHAPRENWPFFAMENLIRLTPDSSDLRRADLGKQLDVGSATLFKVWKLYPYLRAAGWTAVAVLSALVLSAVIASWDAVVSLPALSVGGWAALAFFTVVPLFVPLVKWLNPQSVMRSYLYHVLAAYIGCVAFNIHLLVFDRLFLRRGRLKRLMELK